MLRRILTFGSPLAGTGVRRYFGGSTLVFALGLFAAVWPLRAAAQTSFGGINIGSSTTTAATITIPNAATLSSIAVVTGGAANQDFTDATGGTCSVGTNYAANATCTVNVTFAPKYAGLRFGAVVLADASNNVIGTGYLQGTGQGPQVTFLPGTQTMIASGFVDPDAVAVDGSGNLYIGDAGSIVPAPGAAYKETLSNGTYTQSTLGDTYMMPLGMAVDGAGNVYIANGECAEGTPQCGLPQPNCLINFNGLLLCKETLLPNGQYAQSGISYNGGLGLAPSGVAVDGGGNVYIADDTDTAAQVYQELLQPNGSYTQGGYFALGPPYYVFGIAVDANANLYITTSYPPDASHSYTQGIAYILTPSGSTYTKTQLIPNRGYPDGIAVDATGSIYLANVGNGPPQYGGAPAVYRFTPQSNGTYTEAFVGSGFGNPESVATDGSGNVYVADAGANSITGPPPAVYKVDVADPPALSFATTAVGSTSTDSPKIVTVSNFGTLPLKFSVVTFPADFPENSSATTDCTATTSLAPGETCTLTINFTPVTPLAGKTSLTLSENVVITTNTLNTTATKQKIKVTGTETLPSAATPVFLPTAGTYTSAQSVTISDTTPGALIYYTTDGTTPTASSTQYSGAITVSDTETVEAIAVATGYLNSSVASATYTINLPPPDFSVAVSPPSVSVLPGQKGTVTVSVTPQNGFASAVSFTCSGLPSGASCSFSPASITPSGGAATTTLTVSTSTSVGVIRHNSYPLFPGATLALAVCCFGWKKRRRMHMGLAAGVFGLSLLTGCGGGSSTPTPPPPITSTVTVTATAGSLQHAATFSLTVQ